MGRAVPRGITETNEGRCGAKAQCSSASFTVVENDRYNYDRISSIGSSASGR